MLRYYFLCFFFSSRRRHTRCALVTWSSDVCSSDLYEAISDDPALFSSDERAILKLGLGRNMVKSIRFWGDAFGLTRQAGGETRATEFADRLLDPEAGLDRYLETPGSLWRLHWTLATHGGLGDRKSTRLNSSH